MYKYITDWSSTKQTSLLTHRNVTYSHHDIHAAKITHMELSSTYSLRFNMRQVQPETLPKNSNCSSCLQNIKLKNNTTKNSKLRTVFVSATEHYFIFN